MELVTCQLQDLALLQRIAVQTFEETFAEENTQENSGTYISKAFSLEKLREEMNNPASTFYLAVENDEVIGYMKLNDSSAQTELNDVDALEIERIYVAQHFHGTGSGGQLLEKAISTARKLAKKYIWLGVWEKNRRAIRFYEKNGFYRFGEHTFQLGNDRQIDYLLRKDL